MEEWLRSYILALFPSTLLCSKCCSISKLSLPIIHHLVPVHLAQLAPNYLFSPVFLHTQLHHPLSVPRVMRHTQTTLFLLRRFPCLWSTHGDFNLHVLRSSAIFTCFSFMAFLIVSFHLGFGLPIFRCPPTSIFPVVITKYSSVFLYTWPNHLGIASLILFTYFCHTCPRSYFFCLDLLNPLYAHHPSQDTQTTVQCYVSSCLLHSWSSIAVYSVRHFPVEKLI